MITSHSQPTSTPTIIMIPHLRHTHVISLIHLLILFSVTLLPISSTATSLPLSMSVSTSTLCRPGYYRPKSLSPCTPCPSGTYRSAGSANVCVPCPAGTFQPLTGVPFRARCRPCYPGTHAARPGSASCSACLSGKSSGYGSSRCVRCPRGTAIKFRGAARCVPCPASQYASKVNTAYCDYCPPRTKLRTVVPRWNPSLGKRNVGCVACQPGDECYKCPLGMYLDKVAGVCVDCPLGTDTQHAGGYATSVGECKPCKKGFKRNRWEEHCITCTVHPNSDVYHHQQTEAIPQDIVLAPGIGAHACLSSTNPSKCPHSHFVNHLGVCTTCPPGSRRDAASKQCTRCPNGFAGKGGLSTVCEKCPPDTKVTRDGKGCTCGPGKHLLPNGKCTACEAGTFRNDEDHVPDRGCEPCRPGWIASLGATTCTKCAYGSVPNKDRTKCVVCDTSKGLVPNMLTVTDIYYEYGQTECVDGRSKRQVDYYH